MKTAPDQSPGPPGEAPREDGALLGGTRQPTPVGGAVPGAQTIGRYTVVGRLGVGGMGEVLLARASGTSGFEKEVVIKRILPHLAGDPDFVFRFIEEGKLVVKLRHANIAQVLDMGEDGGVVFIAMEHIDGKDLSELLRLAALAGLTMPQDLVLYLLIELLEALDYVHHAKDADGTPLGLIHRDVTPSNIMISKAGEVKLLDFGIARATERLKTSVSGAIRGKYGYMSPQQAAGLDLDPRSDLFSVGVIAWELLGGVRPFDGPSDLSTLDRIRHHDPGPLSQSAPQVLPELSDWVGRMLAKAPEDRFASAHEASQALRRLLVQMEATPSARQLAAWYERVVATLPDGLQARPVQGLSLDEVLALGLPQVPRGPETMVAAPPVEPASGVASLGPVEAIAAPGERASKRRRSGLLALLVGLNVMLIAALVVLIAQLSGNGEELPIPGATEAASASMGSSGGPAGEAADAVLDPVARPGLEAPLGDARLDTSPEPTREPQAQRREAPSPAPGSPTPAPVELIAGRAFGEALASLPETIHEEAINVVIRSSPAGASIAIAGFGVGAAPRMVRVRPGTVLSGRATLADHQPRAFELQVGPGPDETHTVILRALPRGTLRFRFFPAEGTRVELDGKPWPLSSNVVNAELVTGQHSLTLIAKSGKRLSKSFVIEEGQTTNIGTIDLASGE